MQAADIPSMPDLVARGKVLTYTRIEPAVGVREEADAFQGASKVIKNGGSTALIECRNDQVYFRAPPSAHVRMGT